MVIRTVWMPIFWRYGYRSDGRSDRTGISAPEGTGKETIFTYRYPEEDQEIRENQIPYLALIYEISGDEIVAEVYIGDKPHPFYRMKTDGSGAKKIGQVPMAVPSAQE